MSYDGPSMQGFELLQLIAQSGADGLALRSRHAVADSLAKEHLIECRRSENNKETWWITDRGKQWITGVAKKVSQ
jgi:hypothetical protein